MQAVIMAGGKGTRLRPFTTCLPKPLVPIHEVPIIEILIEKLKKCGFTDIIICVNHMASLIQAFCGNGSKFGVNITYSMENEQLGTIGPISQITDLQDNFLVVNGDTLTDLNFREIFSYHINNDSNLTVGTYIRNQHVDFGVINLDSPESDVIRSFDEKPHILYEVAMGINIFNRHFILSYLEERKKDTGSYCAGLDNVINYALSKKIVVDKYKYTGYWLDIGRPEDYDLANK